MDASYERVADDGFDGWPHDDLGYHKFLYTSFGLRLSFGVNKAENMVRALTKQRD